MSVALSTAVIIGAGVSAAAGVGSAVIGSHAAGKAADEQAASAEKALDFQKDVQATNQANYKPYLEAGSTSINKLMEGLNNGTFGPGSNPAFKAPTADEARSTPGYQFTLSQGERGVNASAAAGGGALSGGAVKSSEQFAAGLADSTYGNTFNRSLAGFQANLAKQAQEYSQLYQPASLGENAAAQSGNTAQQVAGNVGTLMTNVGNAQAQGTIGSANAAAGGLNSVANAGQSALGQMIMQRYLSPGSYSAEVGNGGPPLDQYGAPVDIYSPA